MVVKDTFGDKIFNVVNLVLLTLILLLVAYPLYFVILASFSSPLQVQLGNVFLWPVQPTLEGYRLVLRNDSVWLGFRNTLLYAPAHALTTLALILPAAYALNFRDLRFSNIFIVYFMITMFFSGGMIPTFILYTRTLNLDDTRWVLFLPGAFSVGNLIIARTFFRSTIPEELREAAEMDGCSEFMYFFKVILPLSTAIIAVFALFAFVGNWNSWWNAMMYLTDREGANLVPLQIVLRRILIQAQVTAADLDMNPDQTNHAEVRLRVEQMKYSLIIIASVPVLIIYPFVQKHFVKGIMIGSLKG